MFYYDTTWFKNDLQRGSLEWVLNNWKGKVILVINTYVWEQRSIRILEAMTILENDYLGRTKKYVKFGSFPTYIETNSIELARLQNREDLDIMKMCSIAEEIDTLTNNIEVIWISKFKRKAMAHGRRAFEREEKRVWEICCYWMAFMFGQSPCGLFLSV